MLHTAENHCPAMSQRATIELRVLHAGLMYRTSLSHSLKKHVIISNCLALENFFIFHASGV